jgi:hypothetical protein
MLKQMKKIVSRDGINKILFPATIYIFRRLNRDFRSLLPVSILLFFLINGHARLGFGLLKYEI